MKKVVIFLTFALCILAPLFSQAQYNFPLGELEKATAKNPSDFETFVMEKDYSPMGKESTAILKVYSSDKASESGKKNRITRYQVPNAACKIEFSTTDKKYYLDIKSKLGTMGFKFLGEETRTINGAQASVYKYSNGAFQLTLATYSADANWYVVEVHV